ncbi:TPA: hypothetical protein ACGPA8_000565 [Streptococcus suis]
MTITIREIKENIFYVNERQNESEQGIMVRKVTVGNFYTKHNNSFYRRLLACIIILKSSKKIQEDYPELFGDIIKRLDKEGFPDALDHLSKLDKYVKYNRNNIDDTQVPKPVAYLLFMLVSFYNLNGLLNDFYLMFSRTFAYEKEQLVIQKLDCLLKDDFLLSMLIFGLDELELSEDSFEYFESLQEKYIEKSNFYQDVIQEKKLIVSKSFEQSVNTKVFLIKDEDKALLKENEVFDNLKKMTPEERKQTEELILSLFVFNISPRLRQEIEEKSYLSSQISSKSLTLVDAIKKTHVRKDLKEYQWIQPLEQAYRYIDEDIADCFVNKDIPYKLIPFFPIS